jgi:hypothetical protein
MATRDVLKAVTHDPRSLGSGTHSPWLAQARFDGVVGRQYAQALRDFSRALGWLVWDVARRVGPRRVVDLVRGHAELEDADLDYVHLSAERLTQMLAHLHIGRLLAQQAERWPERRPLAERFMRRTADVCSLNARRILRGDRDALEAIQQWHASATA